MSFKSSITKRVRKRTNKAGEFVFHTRHVLNYRHPKDGKRRQEFFERRADAQDRQSELAASIHTDPLHDPTSDLTISKAVDHWLENKRKRVKASSYAACSAVVEHIRGPILMGTRDERAEFKKTGIAPAGTLVQERLGKILVSELRTAHIRSWFNEVREGAGPYTARRAKSFLSSILALAEEDFGIRVPSMPTQLGKGTPKTRKVILEPQQVAQVIQEADRDTEHGIYYAFPFLAGTRPSEQLGLLWSGVDFDQNTIRICRIQERDGTLCETTKTDAGTREIPMGGTLKGDVAPMASPMPKGGRGAISRVPRSRSTAALATPAPRRRSAAVSELASAVLAAGVQAAGVAIRDTPFSPAHLHLDATGARRRGWAGGQDGRPRQSHSYARHLYPGGAGRRGRRSEARRGLFAVTLEAVSFFVVS